MRNEPKSARRRGAVAPLCALLIVPLLGMCAYSIDVGYIIVCHTDLQNAADAAAMAGAERLQELYVLYLSPGADQNAILTQATTNVGPSGSTPGSPMYTAEQFAYYNVAGGVSIQVPDSDVVFGVTDSSGNFSTTYTGFPNTIQVTTRRDDTANTPLPLFFGPVFNKPTQSMTAMARATIYAGTGNASSGGDVTTLQAIPGVSAHILPVALDVNIWQMFVGLKAGPNGQKLVGQSPDGTVVYNSTNNQPQLHIYPNDTNTPGSFGLIDVGQPANDVPAFRAWIDTGVTPNDIGYLLTNNLLPVSLDSPANWKVGPGMKSTLQTNFESVMWQPNMIPLFTPYQVPATWNWTGQNQDTSTSPQYIAANGNGQGATYAVVGFVGITLSQADGRGYDNMNISIQRMANINPVGVISASAPATTSTTTQFGDSPTIFLSAKITGP
jgi:Flp pilus assembly protein TadG